MQRILVVAGERIFIRILRKIAKILKRFDVGFRIDRQFSVGIEDVSARRAKERRGAERAGHTRHIIHHDTAVRFIVRFGIFGYDSAIFEKFRPRGRNPFFLRDTRFGKNIRIVLQAHNPRTHGNAVTLSVDRNVGTRTVDYIGKLFLIQSGEYAVLGKITHIRFADHDIHRHFAARVIIADVKLLRLEKSVAPAVFDELLFHVGIFLLETVDETFGEQRLIVKLRALRFAAKKRLIITLQRRGGFDSERNLLISVHLADRSVVGFRRRFLSASHAEQTDRSAQNAYNAFLEKFHVLSSLFGPFPGTKRKATKFPHADLLYPTFLSLSIPFLKKYSLINYYVISFFRFR